MSDDSAEIEALKDQVNRLADHLAAFQRLAQGAAKEQRRNFLRTILWTFDQFNALEMRIGAVESALLKSDTITSAGLSEAEAELRAGLSVERAVDPEWSARDEQFKRLRAEFEQELTDLTDDRPMPD